MHDTPDFDLLPAWIMAPVLALIAFAAWVTGKRHADVEDDGRTWIDG